MVYKRMTRSGMCKLSQQWGCFTDSLQMETSLMSFSVHLLFNIYYISATFPHKLHFSSCILEIECAIIWTLLFFVPFRDIEKGKVFCRAILIIIRLENESPWWYPRNRKPLIFLGFFRSSDASSPLYLSCLSLRFPAGFWRRFQAKPYMESCPSGRRCSTRNLQILLERSLANFQVISKFFPIK